MAIEIPTPPMDDDSRPFWEGAQKQKLMIQHCEDCQKSIFYPRIICPHCFSENVKWIEASGKGKIYSYTVVHKTLPPFKTDTPFVIAIIELQEGARMMSRIVGPREEVKIDKQVTVTFEKINDELTLPYFKITE